MSAIKEVESVILHDANVRCLDCKRTIKESEILLELPQIGSLEFKCDCSEGEYEVHRVKKTKILEKQNELEEWFFRRDLTGVNDLDQCYSTDILFTRDGRIIEKDTYYPVQMAYIRIKKINA
jgi:hypothetical protein